MKDFQSDFWSGSSVHSMQKRVSESLTCPIAHGVVPRAWPYGVVRDFSFPEISETLNDITFEVSTLVAVYSGRETVVDDVVFRQYF